MLLPHHIHEGFNCTYPTPPPTLTCPSPSCLPAVEGRVQLLNINLQGVKMEEGVKLEEIAELTEGYSGADITSVCR